MQRLLLKSKIYNATVTRARLDYDGSITIDQALMEAVDLWEGEKVLVTSLTSGQRLETYVLKGEKNSGCIEINGSCAHLIKKDEQIIIMSFCVSADPIAAKKIVLGEGNRVVS